MSIELANIILIKGPGYSERNRANDVTTVPCM